VEVMPYRKLTDGVADKVRMANLTIHDFIESHAG